MSFLAEVLSAAEKMEVEHLRKKIPELSTEIGNLKSETWHYINNVYSKFKERPQRNDILLKKTSKSEEEMDVLRGTIQEHLKKDVPKVEKEISNLAVELEKTKLVLRVVSKIVHVHDGLVNIRNLRKQNSLIEALKEIQTVSEKIRGLEMEEEIKKAVGKIKIDLEVEETLIRESLNTVFGDNVLLDNKNMDAKVVNAIRISKENDAFKDALLAFYTMDSVIFPLHRVSEFLLEHIFQPIVLNSTKIEIMEDENSNTLTLISDSESQPTFYKEVLSTLLQVFEYLQKHLNYPLNEDLTSLEYISNEIKSSLIESIIKYCLLNTIPSTEENLKKYDSVITDVADFEKRLKEYRVFQDNETHFTDYVGNIDVLYINKKCQDYTEKAIVLMRKDLHEMVEVGVFNENKPFFEETHEFPKCSVSKSTIEILNLAETMLEKATESTEICGGRLLNAIQNIFNMYGSVVTEYHQKMIQTIPQQVALFKNNCWYLAYQLDRWNETYRERLPSLTKTIPPLFKDQSHQLRTFGANVFQEYVQGQVRQIKEILQNSDIARLQTCEKLDSNTEKSIRQCLRQQELLKTVWQKVLTYNNYNETLGFIFSSFCNSLVTYVLAVEDIPAEVAEQMVDAFKIVQTRGPKLFTDPKEVTLYVDIWYRFNELVFMLHASLVEINDRWADGKGPLALALKPEEIKRLIRALFQNTDRRAAILARIS